MGIEGSRCEQGARCTSASCRVAAVLCGGPRVQIRVLTSSNVVSAASWEAAEEGLRPDDCREAAAESLGTAAAWGGAAVTTKGLETAA